MSKEAPGTAGKGLAAQSEVDPIQIGLLYDDWAASGYDADLAVWGYDAPQVAAGLIVEALSIRTGGDLSGPVLDAGCGTGLVGAELRRLGVDRITGGDFSPASVDAARSRGVYDEVVALDLNAPLDFAEGRFGAAAASASSLTSPIPPPRCRSCSESSSPAGLSYSPNEPTCGWNATSIPLWRRSSMRDVVLRLCPTRRRTFRDTLSSVNTSGFATRPSRSAEASQSRPHRIHLHGSSRRVPQYGRSV